MGKKVETRQNTGEPPAALVVHWRETTPLAAPGVRWIPFRGGRTNAIWRVDGTPGPLVIKLFRPGSDTPLFPNDPNAEARALTALAGTGLSPELLAMAETPAGPSLAYRYVPGRAWRQEDGPGGVARALARLHRTAPPPGLDRAPGGPQALRTQTRQMLESPGVADRGLAAREPGTPEPLPEVAPVFLHGDPTAGNTLLSETGVTFIDWQCPAVGDPTLDLAVFLSPAMQAVSGNRPLTQAEVTTFLEAYDDPEVAARYRALAPLYHWRMATYCEWRAARGDAGYARAANLEVACLT